MDGGQRDVFKLSHDRLSVQEVVDAVGSASCGAMSLFIGTTRADDVDGRKVIGLEYEAYEGMVQSELAKLCADVRAKWPNIVHICVHHRLGWVEVGEASIVIAISSPHRRDSQEAIQFCVTQLKATVPIWKKVSDHLPTRGHASASVLHRTGLNCVTASGFSFQNRTRSRWQV